MPKIHQSNSGSGNNDSSPEALKPYESHGLIFNFRKGSKDATTDCPFCGREGKFNVNIENSKYGCVVCGEKGNQYVFLRKLYEVSLSKEADNSSLIKLAESKSLLTAESLLTWGVCKSITTGRWLCPGYNEKGNLVQLYQYTFTGSRWAWFPTGGVGGHALIGMNLFDGRKPIIILCEGLWDGMSLYEVLSRTKSTEQGYASTGSIESSLLSDKNILCFPSSNVFKEAWAPLFSNQTVILMSQNDHPHFNEKTNSYSAPASWSGMERIVGMLSSCKEPPTGYRILKWGENGYDLSLKSGYDVRDLLTYSGTSLASRITSLSLLDAKLADIPTEWLRSDARGSNEGEKDSKPGLRPIRCETYKVLTQAWRKAMRWRQSMDDVLSVMLAVAASTVQVGDQLFLQVIGSAGGGKTKFCDAMLVSSNCYALEHLTGFYSGWKGPDGEDYSLINRINRKTLITPEGDVIMSSQSFSQIMSEQRRIFDGTSGSTFKNQKEDNRYVGLRTPWIMAGTPAMMDRDQSHLGDRFLKVVIDDPDDYEKRDILKRCGHAALGAVMQSADGGSTKFADEKFTLAFQLTGGYIDFLRDNVDGLLTDLEIDADELVDYCARLGEFTADCRARPDPESHKKDSSIPNKELPTRLTHQFVRLACCLAIVLNKPTVDNEVLRRVKKVAIDTGRGITLSVLRVIRKYELNGIHGMEVKTLALTLNKPEDKTRMILRFMRDIGMVRLMEPKPINGIQQKAKWFMTERMKELYLHVMEGE